MAGGALTSARCARRYAAPPTEFQALIAAIQSNSEPELVAAVERIARGVLDANRKPKRIVRKPKAKSK